MLAEKIGTAAMLEQVAEECTELAQACLKLARYFRKENPVYKDKNELYSNLSEEVADVKICLDELMSLGLVTYESVDSNILSKSERMKDRLDSTKARTCINCKNKMFSDFYVECQKGYRGIVAPCDTCDHWEEENEN